MDEAWTKEPGVTATLCQGPTTLVTINGIYLSLTKPPKTIDEELYRGYSEARPAGGA